MEVVPLMFDYNAGKTRGWSNWVDQELSDASFVSCLDRARVLKSVAMSRNLDGYRDAKGLRHLVYRWSPPLTHFSSP